MPRGYQGLGILRACNIDRMRWRKFKRAPRNTRNEGQNVLLSSPMMQKGIKKLGTNYL